MHIGNIGGPSMKLPLDKCANMDPRNLATAMTTNDTSLRAVPVVYYDSVLSIRRCFEEYLSYCMVYC